MNLNLNLTDHAKKRMQQRSIPQMVLDWLINFGQSEPAGDGARKYFFDKTSRKNFKKYAGQLYGPLEQYLDAYVVLASDSSVVTVAVRCEHIRRN